MNGGTTNNNAISEPLTFDILKNSFDKVYRADGKPWWGIDFSPAKYFGLGAFDLGFRKKYEAEAKGESHTFATYLATCGNERKSKWACRGCEYINECK